MRARIYILLLAMMPAGLIGQTASDIVSSKKRMETLDVTRTLLTPKGKETAPAEIAQKDPFNPKQPITEVAQGESSPLIKETGLGDREVLIALANSVAPSGTMQLGDTPILLFGQKKLKVGDSLPIVFQGATYNVYIGGIERTSFTLRLNKEEIIRPIKPVNKP
jgi:hypothetical protein